MTKIKKPTRSLTGCSAYNVMKVLFTLIFLISAALILFQLDAFPRKHRYKGHSVLTPDQLVVAPQLRQESRHESGFETVEDHEDSDSKDNVVEVRRYVMELGGLPDEPSTASVILEIHGDWAPIGAKHFDELITTHHFYDECRFFRVVPDFVVQFGIGASPDLQRLVKQTVLQDDPVAETNAFGTLTYATSGPNTRTTQLFINTRTSGNAGLDRQGFSPIGRVVEGMEHILRINAEYGQNPNQGKINQDGNVYLKENFPRLSYISSIRRES